MNLEFVSDFDIRISYLRMLRLMRYPHLYFIISALFLIPGIFSLVRWGLQPSIDFTGGSILETKIESHQQPQPQAGPPLAEATSHQLEEIIENENVDLSSIQTSGDNTFILRMKEINEEKKNQILAKIKEEIGETEELRFETIGPTLGAELLRKTLIALVLAVLFILSYVTYQFKDKKYGICAILAVFHDTLIVLGTFSLLGHFVGVEVDTLFVTAVLTILSFSIHDTVVVYDRIRESIKKYPKAAFESLADKAVLETLARSVNNSMTIIFMLLSLWLLGGETIRWFVLALLVGSISGTYSSTFTAVPLLVVWERFKKRK